MARPVGFYWTSTRILQVCFKWIRIANFIEKCNKNFYWMSSKISIGRLLESTGRPVELVYWTSSRAEELAEYDKIVLQTSKMVALGAVIKLYYVNTWISLHAWLLARLEMKFHLKLKLSHTWAAMLRLELNHLAQKIISKENPRGEGAFAVPCLSPLFWHYTMEC